MKKNVVKSKLLRATASPAPGDSAPSSLLPMEIQIGDRFTDHGKSLRARIQRPGLPETGREITWPAHERVEVRRHP